MRIWRLSVATQILRREPAPAIYDRLGGRGLLNACYGWEVGADILQMLGRQTLRLEREFNRRAGFTAAADHLPGWMTRAPLPLHNTVFDVAESELDAIFVEM
jgi:aldehyde:ferredoxin oxidoreductase